MTARVAASPRRDGRDYGFAAWSGALLGEWGAFSFPSLSVEIEQSLSLRYTFFPPFWYFVF
jgi:hypothetical protein